jgi:hypothetical protein
MIPSISLIYHGFGPREQTLMDLDVVGLIAGMELPSQHEGRLPQKIGTIGIDQLLSCKPCNRDKSIYVSRRFLNDEGWLSILRAVCHGYWM